MQPLSFHKASIAAILTVGIAFMYKVFKGLSTQNINIIALQ